MMQLTADILSWAYEAPEMSYSRAPRPICLSCGHTPLEPFADLGAMPLANALLADLDHSEIAFPLRAVVCPECLLVQLGSPAPDPGTLFPDSYPFRSGQSVGWMNHCRKLADIAIERLNLGPLSRVLEIGSNDGTGLRRFRALGIPAIGIEPCQDVAREAALDGLATLTDWWTAEYAQRMRASGYQADLVIARNVVAHVPDPGDFLSGIKTILAPGGTLVIEVPWVANLLNRRAWDQIYHEHRCYFSLQSLTSLLKKAGLEVADACSTDTHGGSLQVWVRHEQNPLPLKGRSEVGRLQRMEHTQGLNDIETYRDFASVPGAAKIRVRYHLSAAIRKGFRIVGYGASAKAATFLNFCGIGPETIEAVVDTTPVKQGKWLPGSRVPVVGPEWLASRSPNYVLNFCWNWRKESEEHITKLCPGAKILYPHEL